ncbi:sigma 54-interacting transcriptional regulator [Bacillus sp. WMMC1349]|uniref:sigma-54-dependent transcriptional regulator n=1 Tax=Bacillus sp. WMMC1349 TaxID=2736254 RepID=UPI001557BBE6|nr:sigma-54-dependent transcriptional regulator [Bacillus sp. WMMC1349]NPC91520.1 sigma 54-interacting transcriptional regulator [Bacillus sp. WMMC1349]
MLKKDLLSYLDEETCHFDWDKSAASFTASEISKLFHVKRNTVSHYLNQLVHKGLVVKINTRPVYFLSRKIFEEKKFQLSTCIFDSFQELKELEPIVIGLDLFDQLIGADGSLKRAIEQIKTSVCYPDGLPIILHGPTGVGKSYLANLIYQYSLEKGILPKNAPFIRFNCAQYANNAELLSSNLFGYVKGAFTGADATKRGLLDAADGGILFLDEVHRLNEEGQEKLFTFLDQGIFRRMGESEGEHQANVRLIFATTEELERSFLRTFLRRIPIKVWIPGLDERGEKEKKQFVYLFLIKEAQKLQLPLRISTRALDALMKHHYDGNMGELKNLIKYIAASVFVKKEAQKEVSITLLDLPESILEDTIRYTDNKYKQNHEIIISPNTTLDQLFQSSTSYLSLIKTTYSHILKFYEEHQSTNFDRSIFEKYIFNETNLLFDNLIFHASKKHAGVMMELTTVNVQDIFHHLENMFNVRFNGNSVYTMAYFLYYKGNAELQLLNKQKTLIENLSKFVDLNYKTEQQLAKQLVHFIESKLDVKLYKMDKIFLTFYLRSIAMEQTNNKVKAIILAHGYATASSIANVANRLLRKNMFEAFDMPIDVSVEDIAAQVLNYIEHNDVSEGLVILVDMGSLKDIYSQFKLHINGPVVIMNNVSTQMALYLGDMLNKDLYLEDMIERP